MLCVCIVDVMDVLFSVCIVMRGAVFVFCLDLVRGCLFCPGNFFYVGMVVCISWLHSYL